MVRWLLLANVDGSGRQVKLIQHVDGFKLEAGCFTGSDVEFVDKAQREDKFVYVEVVKAVCMALRALN